MKTILSSLLGFFLLTISAGSVFSQTTGLTKEEINATNELVKQFNAQLDSSGQITPLLDKLFVSDFSERYVKEETRRQNGDEKSRTSILYTSGIDYDPSLLKAAIADDWRQFYIATFDFMQYGVAVTLNATAKSMLAGTVPDEDELEALMNNMYPADVMKLINSNVITRNYLRKQDDKRPIRGVDELRETSKVLLQANQILTRSGRGKLSPDAHKALAIGSKKLGDLLSPRLELCDRECYGFPTGTRLISVFATPMYRLLILKMGENYKILEARHSSPD